MKIVPRSIPIHLYIIFFAAYRVIVRLVSRPVPISQRTSILPDKCSFFFFICRTDEKCPFVDFGYFFGNGIIFLLRINFYKRSAIFFTKSLRHFIRKRCLVKFDYFSIVFEFRVRFHIQWSLYDKSAIIEIGRHIIPFTTWLRHTKIKFIISGTIRLVHTPIGVTHFTSTVPFPSLTFFFHACANVIIFPNLIRDKVLDYLVFFFILNLCQTASHTRSQRIDIIPGIIFIIKGQQCISIFQNLLRCQSANKPCVNWYRHIVSAFVKHIHMGNISAIFVVMFGYIYTEAIHIISYLSSGYG